MPTTFKDLFQWIWRSSKRIVVFVIGAALVVAGLVMLVFPGPGLLVIVAGLAVLATEFAWAKVALDKTKEKASQAGGVAKKGLGRLRGRKPALDAETDQPPPST